MKKTNKKMLSVFALSAIALASGAVGAGMIDYSASAEAGLPTAAQFEINAVSIREKTEDFGAGVRFRIQMDKTAYDNLPTGATFGAKLLPTYYLGEGETLETTKNETVVDEAITEWTVDGDKMTAIAYVYDVPATHYGSDFAVAAYVSDGTNTVYTAQKVVCVAEQALLAEAEGESVYANYYTFAYNFYNEGAEDTTADKTGTAKYGETLVNEEIPSVDGKVFVNWTNKAGTKVWDLSKNTVTAATNLYASYIAEPTAVNDTTLKLVDKTKAVDTSAWFANASELEANFDLTWNLSRINRTTKEGELALITNEVITDVTNANGNWADVPEGVQTLTVKATAKADPSKVYTVYTAQVDVYDEVPELVADMSAVAGSRMTTDSGGATTTRLESYQGRTNVIKSSKTATGSKVLCTGIVADPLHSLEYYTMLAGDSSKTYYLSYEFRATASVEMFDYTAKSMWKDPNVWIEQKIALSDLVAVLETVPNKMSVNTYLEQMRVNFSNINATTKYGPYQGALISGYNGDNAAYELYTTMPMITVEQDGGTLLKKNTDTLVLSELVDATYGDNYTVVWTLDGVSVDNVDLTDMDGVYDLRMTATTGSYSEVYPFMLDVYPANETAPVLIDGIQNIKFVQAAAQSHTGGTTTYEQKDGVDVATNVSSGDSDAKILAVAKFKHTKAYYEKMATEGDWNVTFTYWMSGPHDTIYFYNQSEGGADGSHQGEFSSSISLTEFLTHMDGMLIHYERGNYDANTNSDQNKNNHCFIGLYVDKGNADCTLTLTLPTIVAA